MSQNNLLSISVIVVPNEDPDLSQFESPEDQDVLNAIVNGSARVMSIRAEAKVLFGASETEQTIQSEGISNVAVYGDGMGQQLHDFGKDQIELLKGELENLGFESAEISAADENVHVYMAPA